MLNPEFRRLDPDPEQLARLASLAARLHAGGTGLEFLHSLDRELLEKIGAEAARQLAVPGHHPAREVAAAVREAARARGIELKQGGFGGWPETVLSPFLAAHPEPRVWVLGVLDGDGIWAGCLAGASRGGLDFLATPELVWMDEPELAAKQTLQDLANLAQAVGKRFGRPVAGLYIFRNEFERWRDSGFDPDVLQSFIRDQVAAQCWS